MKSLRKTLTRIEPENYLALSKFVFLDTGIIGLVTHPSGGDEPRKCINWLFSLIENDIKVCIPEVCDYEIRRGYLHRNNLKSLTKLDQLIDTLQYIPINSSMMRKAAELWAKSRQSGKTTADPKELDGDVVLCAQALLSIEAGDELVIATTNVGHLSYFVSASAWETI